MCVHACMHALCMPPKALDSAHHAWILCLAHAQEGPFPAYDAIQPKHVVPGMKQLLKELNEALTQLEANVQPTWAGLMEPFERLSDKHRWTWGAVSHLKSVKDSPQLRKVSVAAGGQGREPVAAGG